VNYNSKEVTVTANSSVVAPETSDSGNLVEVTIQDVNSAPDVYAYFNNYYMSENATQANFYVSARDPNSDTIRLVSLTLNGTPLVEGTHYEVTQRSSGNSYDYFYATLDLEHEDISGITAIEAASLSAGNYTLVATYSDSIATTSGVGEAGLVVEANQAPVINGIYLQSETEGYININSEISAGTYNISAYAYDSNGDAIVLTYRLDSNATADTNNTVVLTDGEHTITVIATEVDGTNPLSDQESFTVVVGDRSPSVDPFTAEVNDNDTVNGNLIPTDDFSSTVALVGTAPNGLTLYITGAYTFDGRAHNDLAEGETRDVVANLRVTNRYGSSDTNLTVTVTGTNDAPTLTIAESIVSSAAGVEIPYAATDVDGSVSVSAEAVNGTVVVGDENFTYTPNAGATSDTVTVTATDGDLNATRIVIVTFGNQPPSLGFHNYFEVDGGASITAQIDFSDDGETPATVAIAEDPVSGLTINADGTLTYSAAAFAELALDEIESIYVNVRVTDSEGLETVGEISIIVHGIYTPPLADGGFTQGMSIYSFERDEDGSVSASSTTVDEGNLLSETDWYLDVNTGEFVLDSATGGEEDAEYFLLDGVWTQGWNNSTYELINGNVRLNNGFMVSILRTIDLVNPSAADAEEIAALSAEIPGNPTIEFTSGAEAYVIGMKAPEMYLLTYQPTLQVQNATGEWISTETPFNTLLDYMSSVNSPAGSYSATGVFSGIDFERSTSGEAAYFHAYPVVDSTGEIISSLVAGMSGGLVVVDYSATPVTQQEVGSWSVITLPNGAGLALELTLTAEDSSSYLLNLIAVTNGTVYQGVHRVATTSFEVDEDDTVGLNSIAFEDVKDAIRTYLTGGSGESTLNTLLAGRTLWSQIEGENGTLESQTFNSDATVVTWTEITNPGGSLCTGTVSVVFETNATVTGEGLTDSCGSEDIGIPFNVSVEASEGWNYILVGGDKWYFSEADARADFLGDTTTPPSASDATLVSLIVGNTLYYIEDSAGATISFDTGTVSDSGVYSGYSGGIDANGGYGINDTPPNETHSYVIDGTILRVTEVQNGDNDGEIAEITFLQYVENNGVEVSVNMYTLDGMFAGSGTQVFYLSAVDRDAAMSSPSTFKATTYFSGTKYFVNENGLEGYRTFDVSDGSYIGVVGLGNVSGGFIVNDSDNTMQIMNYAGTPDQETLLFTYVGTAPNNGVSFDLSINGDTAFKTYMFDTEAERDSMAATLY
jgi:VCBS repeat-containing protein